MVIEAQRGFTLIELLVVIAIISFLASIVMVSLDSARGKARNAKRNSDIIQLYATFQLGYDANGAYPSTDGAWACVSYACYGSWSPFVPIAAVDNFLSPYIKKPSYPAIGGEGGYVYNSSWSAAGWVAGAYFSWLNDPGGNCGQGVQYSSSESYTQCMLKID